MEVQKILEEKGKSIRICSVPSVDLLYKQGQPYLDQLKGNATILIAIEAASSFGWHKIIGTDGIFFGLDRFGESAPAKDLYKFFDLTPDVISNSIEKLC